MLIEKIKADAGQLRQWLDARGYALIDAGIKLRVIDSSDKTLLIPATQPASRASA